MYQQSTLRILRGALAAACVWFPLTAAEIRAQADGEAKTQFSQPVLIRFEGVITPLSEQFLYRKLEVAEDKGADVLIVEIDSPGGSVESTLNIAYRLRDLDWAHTVAFVPREALSGAAIIALSCDEIIMHPAAVLGDAGPIVLGEDSLFRHAPEKIRSDLARKIRDLAEAKHRPPALAEAMVNMDLVVYHVRHRQTGEETFMSEAEIESSGEPNMWEKGKPVHESREEHFLEVNGKRAFELNLAEGNAKDRDELKQLLGFAGDPIVLQPSGVDTAVFILNAPLITGILFVVGLIALYIEFSAPGLSVGGLIALLCFALFFWSRFLGGTAEVLEVILFVVGIVFIAVEIFVIPGFGVSGIAGLLLMFAAVMMACQSFVIPQTARQMDTFATSLLVVSCSAAAFVGGAMMLSRHFNAIPLFNRLALKPVQPAGEGDAVAKDSEGKPLPQSHPDSDLGIQVGDWGVAASPLRPAGKARFADHYLDVLTDGSYVDSGQQVRIIEIRGARIVVREVTDA
ncbi:MAG: peptidase [Pirellulaceae bacterium]|nr:peptidase [Pirellulaceae bacterium]